MATATQNSDDLFRQAMSTWQSAIESSVKMQEDSTKWMLQAFNSEAIGQWHNKGRAAAGETMSTIQESLDETIRVINQQAESSIKLLQNAVQAVPTDGGQDVGVRLAKWWESAVESMNTNTRAILKANSRIITTWSDLARKTNLETADAMSLLAQKTAEQAETIAKTVGKHVEGLARQST